MEAIKRDHRDISSECLSALLSLWLRGEDPNPTWKNLTDVLISPPVGVQVNMESTGKVLCIIKTVHAFSVGCTCILNCRIS